MWCKTDALSYTVSPEIRVNFTSVASRNRVPENNGYVIEPRHDVRLVDFWSVSLQQMWFGCFDVRHWCNHSLPQTQQVVQTVRGKVIHLQRKYIVPCVKDQFTQNERCLTIPVADKSSYFSCSYASKTQLHRMPHYFHHSVLKSHGACTFQTL